MHISRTPEDIAANRRRYEEHQTAGLDFTAKALPGPSPLPPAPLDPASIIHEEIIPGDWYWSTLLQRGEALRIAQQENGSTVALVAWNAHDASERFNLVDTAKVQWTTALSTGRVIFSDMGRVMLSITADSCGLHDCLAGGSSAASNAMRHAGSNTRSTRNTRDNLVLLAGKLGLNKRDIPGIFNLFAPVRPDETGALAWRGAPSDRLEYVDLRAEMDLRVGLSNCPHPLDPSPGSPPAPIFVTRFRAPEPAADDLARTASAEAARGFENNARAQA